MSDTYYYQTIQNEDSVEIKFQMPGVSKDEIDVLFYPGVLFSDVGVVFKNDKTKQHFAPLFIESLVNEKGLTASMKDGLLKVNIPFKSPINIKIT